MSLARTRLTQSLAPYLKPYHGDIFRTVEGQHVVSTRKLVQSDDEQRVLEEILERSKPTVLTENSRGALHYLLYTPFRYPPLKSGTRFHTRREPSLFYGSEDVHTSLAEVAYRRFLFMAHTDAVLKPMQVPYTHFSVSLASNHAIWFTHPPFLKARREISDPSSYATSQALGPRLRAAGAELFRYFSARARDGVNVGVFSNEAFARNRPLPGKEKQWSVYVSHERVEFRSAAITALHAESHVFCAEDFYVGGTFPVVA